MTFKLRATSPPWEDPGRWLLVEEVGRAGALRWRFDKRLLAAEGAGHMHDILRGVWTLSTCSGVIRPVCPPTPLIAPGDGKAGESTFPSDSDMHLVDSCLQTRGPWRHLLMPAVFLFLTTQSPRHPASMEQARGNLEYCPCLFTVLLSLCFQRRLLK